MSKQEALLQSLATSGAVLVTFVAVCHELVGARLFPWGPDAFGGPIGWHGVGLGGIAMGLLLVCGTLRVISFPVFPWALVVAAVGLVIALYTTFAHREFHMFAFTVFLAAIATAVFYRKASRLAAVREPPQPAA